MYNYSLTPFHSLNGIDNRYCSICKKFPTLRTSYIPYMPSREMFPINLSSQNSSNCSYVSHTFEPRIAPNNSMMQLQNIPYFDINPSVAIRPKSFINTNTNINYYRTDRNINGGSCVNSTCMFYIYFK